MTITLDKISKRYTTGWVLKDIDAVIRSGEKVAITGANGSGKSTLIQIISGFLSASKGQIIYSHLDKKVDRDDIFKFLAISAAYSELDEELTIAELYKHYSLFKPLLIHSLDEFLELTDFRKQKDKEVRYFSSGMKQRLALGFAFVIDAPILLLDEPTSFLDESKKGWYNQLFEEYTTNKTVIIASNDEKDIINCTSRITL